MDGLTPGVNGGKRARVSRTQPIIASGRVADSVGSAGHFHRAAGGLPLSVVLTVLWANPCFPSRRRLPPHVGPG